MNLAWAATLSGKKVLQVARCPTYPAFSRLVIDR